MKLIYLLLILSIIGILCTGFWMNSVLDLDSNWKIEEEVCFHDSPVLAFEFACNAATVAKIFEGDRAAKNEKFRRHTKIDFLFILFYVGLFVILIQLWCTSGSTMYQTLIGASLVVGLSDIIENIHLLSILKHIDQSEAVNSITATMQYFVWAKWILVLMIILTLVILGCRALWLRFV